MKNNNLYNLVEDYFKNKEIFDHDPDVIRSNTVTKSGKKYFKSRDDLLKSWLDQNQSDDIMLIKLIREWRISHYDTRSCSDLIINGQAKKAKRRMVNLFVSEDKLKKYFNKILK